MGCISCAIPRFLRPTTTTTISVSPPLKLSFPTFRCFTVSPAYPALSLSERKEVTSSQIVAREYADLNLSDKFCQEVGHVRIRQHVNPLHSYFMAPVDVPDWNAVYEDATLPLMVDIGSGSGRFLIWLAKRYSGLRNFLGLEIRPKLVTRAEYWVNELALKNIHFVFANATVSFQQLVSTYPGPLNFVSILCPDPHFKKKHHKRRVVQKPLVDSIVEGLVPGGHIFMQSDVLEVALDMRDYFDAESHKLVHIDRIDPDMLSDDDGWLLNNPMGIRTEREIHAEFEGARIFRRMYQKRCKGKAWKGTEGVLLTNSHSHNRDALHRCNCLEVATPTNTKRGYNQTNTGYTQSKKGKCQKNSDQKIGSESKETSPYEQKTNGRSKYVVHKHKEIGIGSNKTFTYEGEYNSSLVVSKRFLRDFTVGYERV